MALFVTMWVIVIGGWLVHALADRHPARRGGPRLVELALLWLLVAGGAWSIFTGIGHIGPNADQIADQIGYAPSMFQWEVGWGDIAVGVLGVGCAWRGLRGRWLTAAVTVLAIGYLGDAVGHALQLAAGNGAPGNVWSLPSDVLQAGLAVVLLLAYRQGRGRLVTGVGSSTGASTWGPASTPAGRHR